LKTQSENMRDCSRRGRHVGNVGYRHTEEAKRRIGIGASRKLSAETRVRMSESARLRPLEHYLKAWKTKKAQWL
jgi:hypothetical protein